MNTETDQPLFTEASEWTGRNDGPGPEHARWHSVVKPLSEGESPAAVVLGYASDEGVLRNGGRQGAAAGSQALRDALGSLAIHDEFPRRDAGTITTQGDDLEGSQEALSNKVQQLNEDGHLVIVLGGGHETAFASHRGAYRANGNQPLGIINLDQHFDLRQEDRPTSGTPFKQIADLVTPDHGVEGFDYTVLGISRPNNTRVLFDTASTLGVEITLDEELLELSPAQAGELARRAAEGREAIHLSIDLDVLPSSTAPGVSAPASLGVNYERIRAMALAIAATGKLKLVDVVELNPRYDVDNRTAKAAARLIADIVSTHAAAL